MYKKLSVLIPTAILLALLVALAPPVDALALYWAVQDGPWNDPNTWNCTCIPGPGDSLSVGFTVDFTGYTNVNSVIENYGTITNSGAFTTAGGGTLANTYGTIQNYGTLTNSGTFYNGLGSIQNHGTINNNGALTNLSGGTLTNSGTIANSGTLTNNGTINNVCGGIITGNAVLGTPPVLCSPGAGSSTVPAPPPDGRLNWRAGDNYAVLYPRRDSHGGPAIHVYCVDSESHGVLALVVTGDDLKGFSSHPAHNTLVKQGELCNARFYILTTGEYQINVGPDWEGKEEVFIFDDLYGSGFYWRELE